MSLEFIGSIEPLPISHQQKFIFIHVPKTAGESIEKKLDVYGHAGQPLQRLWGIQGKYVLQHLTMSQMRRHFISEEIYTSYYKFAFVRNPWDKVVSEYYWYLRYGAPVTFSDYVYSLPVKLLARTNLHVMEVGHNIPQYKYIYDENKQLLVNFVGRFENLAEDFKKVCMCLGKQDPVLPHQKSTSANARSDYRSYYSQETKAIVADLYAKDIDLFHYVF